MLQNVLKDSLSGPPKPLSHSVVGAASAASAGSLLSEKREFCYWITKIGRYLQDKENIKSLSHKVKIFIKKSLG